MTETVQKIRIASSTLSLSVGEQIVLGDGTPLRRMKRFAVKVGGVYKKKSWSSPLVVDDSRVRHWLSMWQAMKADGRPVKVTKDHENRELASSTMGDVVDIAREWVGDEEWIAVIHDVRGQKNIEIAEANKDASIEIEPRVEGINGKVYRDVIAAISYTPIPVISGQPIAASMADEPMYLSNGDSEMDMNSLYCSIAKLSGVKDGDVTAENAKRHVDEHVGRCAGMKCSLETAESTVTKLKAELEKATTDAADFRAKLASAEGQVLKLSTKPETRMLSLQARLGENALDRLAAVYEPAIIKELKAILVGDVAKSEFSPLLLSLHEDDAGEKLIERVATILLNANPIKTGAATQGQKLNQIVPDADPEPTNAEPAYGWAKVFGKSAETTTAAK